MTNYEEKRHRLSTELKKNGQEVRLQKNTSNLFRDRHRVDGIQLDVTDLNEVISVDSYRRTVNVEGMTTYEALADACLENGCMPLVVPQLKSITIGGAVSGIGIESSSFRYGLPHESVLDLEVLLPSGNVVYCTPDNNHADLFFGIPNSYGTLGYVLRLRVQTRPVKRFVALEHRHYSNIENYFTAVGEACREDIDFVDGTIFGDDEMYVTLGRFADEAPFTSK